MTETTITRDRMHAKMYRGKIPLRINAKGLEETTADYSVLTNDSHYCNFDIFF